MNSEKVGRFRSLAESEFHADGTMKLQSISQSINQSINQSITSPGVQGAVQGSPDAGRRTPDGVATSCGVQPVQVAPPPTGVEEQTNGLPQRQEAGATGRSSWSPGSPASGRHVADAASGVFVQVTGFDVVNWAGGVGWGGGN